MTGHMQSIELTRQIKAAPENVYYALTHEHAFYEWLCDGAWAQQREGGRFFLNWNGGRTVTGQFVTLDKDKSVTLSWQGSDDPGPSEVRFTLEARDGSTALTLAHTGFGQDDAWARSIEQARALWESGLENLQSVVDTGKDLRITRRPMLGILLGEMNAEIAARDGIPVTEGVFLEGVIDGMGAQAAGLQKGDVIVRFAGKPIKDDLIPALAGLQAGNKVEVEFYRGVDKRSVQMTLSARHIPDVPPTAQGLADAIQSLFAEQDVELDPLLDGITEDIASHHPADHEWSVKEVLAHLILALRDANFYMACRVSGNVPTVGPDNLLARSQALLSTLPALTDVRAELRRVQAETVAFLSTLPPEFVARPSDYFLLGWNQLEGTGIHTRLHLDQIRKTIAAAEGVAVEA